MTKIRDGLASRRGFLKASVTLGVGAIAGWGLTSVSEPSDSMVEITYALARSEPASGRVHARTKTVPADWHTNLEQAFAVQEHLRTANLSSFVGSVAVPGSYDDPDASISVVATDRSILDSLEPLVSGLTVELTLIDSLPNAPWNEPTKTESYQISSLDRSYVPAGVVCVTENGTGTLGPALYDAERRTKYFTTSNHLFGADGTKTTEHEGASLSLLHDGATREIGRVVRGYPWVDVVRIAPTGGYHPTSKLADVSPGTVIGQYTKVGLADLMARDESLHKFGAYSKHTTGQIKGVDGVTCYIGKICKHGQLMWGTEETMTDGDSGSVTYHPDPDNPEEYVLVGGINNARTWWPGMDFTWGTAGYFLREQYGLHF